MNHLLLPVLALDVGEVIGIIFLVLSVLGYIVKAIKGQAGPANPVAPRKAPDLRRSEIEAFLEEITGSGAARPAPQNRPTPPNRPASKPRAETTGQVKKPPNKVAKISKTAKPVASLSEQHLAKSSVGEGLRSHVSKFVKGERISEEVQQDLKDRISAEVRADLGPSRLSTPAPSVSRPAPHPLISLLRNREGVQQAIALQEILQRPRALRRR